MGLNGLVKRCFRQGGELTCTCTRILAAEARDALSGTGHMAHHLPPAAADAPAVTLRAKFWRVGVPGALAQLMRLILFSSRRLCCRHECGGGPSIFRNWGVSGCRESAAATVSRLAYRRRPTQQLRQLGEVHRHPPRLVARQPIWSPSDATQQYVRNRGRSGSARPALETTLMTPNRPSSVGSYLDPSLASCFLISGLSYKTTFNSELRISSFPLYSI